ncbi:MAG: putative ABC transporter permease [Clostridia bacterium]|nr:putative ABC transporter permease [Clostridia bacterium]
MEQTESKTNSINAVTTADGEKISKKAKMTKVKGEPKKLFGYELPYVGLAMIAFSFFGFLAENIARMATKHIFDCRHQLLPFLFAYGIALFAMLLILGTPDEMRIFNKRIFAKKGLKYRVLSHITYFAIIFAFVFLGEIAVGEFYEACTGVILWDYSDIPLHVTKYTSVISGAAYGGGAYLIMAFGFKPMMKLIQKIGRKTAIILNCTLGVAIVIDFIIMVVTVFVTGAAPEYWSVQF